MGNSNNPWRPKDGSKAIVNAPILKDWEVYKAIDAPTAYQSIANFISGVMPRHPETVTISDRSKILKAGFDLKESFRHLKPNAQR